MKNASNFLSGFPFEKNEEILVDSFSYISNKTKTSYVGFLTNLRFIFRQTQNISLSGMGIQDGWGETEFKAIPLSGLRGIKIKKGRIIFNGDIYDEDGKHTSSDFGSFGKGFGGLSYSSHQEVYSLILQALSKYGKELDFYLWSPQSPEVSTADKKQQKRLTNIVNTELTAALVVCGLLVVGFSGLIGVVSLFEDKTPSYNTSSIESVRY
ncbi:hypothetical protein OAL32_01955 [Synechococcus sp. AH-551-G15]|nr:hypothetical protein [Synechococcus sp. AH-551-G15]